MNMRLFVNIDHVATVRQARRTDEPDPVRAAVLVEMGGGDGITVHLREDRRHIQDRDVRLLLETARTGVNLIITHTQGSGYALPGKLFEYVGARRPVWAITDDRLLRDVITRHQLGYLSSQDARSVEETLYIILRDHANEGKLPEVTPPEQFNVRSLTRTLTEFLTR